MSLLARYAELTAQEKLIEEEKKELNEKILEQMKEQQLGSINAEFGTFSKAQKLVYEYPEEFKQEQDQVKAHLKANEEEIKKTLTPNVKEYLTFRASK